jgi:hypothetical protein
MKEFKYMNKYILKKWNCDEIINLYNNYGRSELKENKK